jgi:hypothetical protein
MAPNSTRQSVPGLAGDFGALYKAPAARLFKVTQSALAKRLLSSTAAFRRNSGWGLVNTHKGRSLPG